MLQYLEKAPVATPEQLAKADRLASSGRHALEAKEESFQRCDTDGFLSQWSHGMTHELNSKNADILRNGGYAQFSVLCDSDGNVISTRDFDFPVKGKEWITNTVWLVENEDVIRNIGRKWIPFDFTGKSRIQKKFGFHQELRWFPAYAAMTVPRGQKSTGLAGCANAYVAIFKKGEKNDS